MTADSPSRGPLSELEWAALNRDLDLKAAYIAALEQRVEEERRGAEALRSELERVHADAARMHEDAVARLAEADRVVASLQREAAGSGSMPAGSLGSLEHRIAELVGQLDDVNAELSAERARRSYRVVQWVVSRAPRGLRLPAQRRPAQRRQTARIGVVHVPKCGGSALREALSQLPETYAGPKYFDRLHYGTDRIASGIPEPKSAMVASSSDIAAIVADHCMVVGHYSVHSLTQAGCDTLAVLVREPRARILSLYRYWQRQPDVEREGWGLWSSEVIEASRRPLASFLADPRVWPAVDNAMARQLLLARTHRRAGGAAIDRRIRGATIGYRSLRSRLRVAEWSQESDRYLERICAIAGQSHVPQLSRVNVSDASGEPQTLNVEDLRRLDRLTRHDSQLLRRLIRDGLLPQRSEADLDSEFQSTAARLGFALPGRFGGS